MWKYILKRLLALIPVMIGVTLIVYVVIDFAPGDPAKTILGPMATPEGIAQLREELGLNDPLLLRYGRYMNDLLHGNLGTSYKTKDSVAFEISQRLPTTAKLAVTATLVSIILAIPLGILAAVKQNTWIDGTTMFVALLGVSIPIFWSGLLLILLFSLK